jgi:glycerophosphoryl diester phosphodiesterase
MGHDPRTVTPITFAHRGGRAHEPDNTLAAFGAALERGARGLETDAWLSGDGEVVLVHDSTLRRGLRRLRVGSTPAKQLRGYGVPRLAELYEGLGTAFELSIDVKDPSAAGPILEAAAAAGATGVERLWLCSPSTGLLRRVRETGTRAHLVHSRSRRHLDGPLERHAADLGAAGIDAMNLHHTEWTTGLVTLFHRFGVSAFAWDVQEVRHIRAVLRMGVDAIYSDHVDRMVQTVNEWSEGAP